MNVASALNYTVQISRECIALRVLVGGGCMKIVLKIVSSTRIEKSISALFVKIFFANRCFIKFHSVFILSVLCMLMTNFDIV